MNKFLNVRSNYPVNYVLDNLVDEDVQAIFLPLNLIHHLMFCPKYRIKNGLITPNTWISNVVSLIATLICLFSYVYRIFVISFYLVSPGLSSFVDITPYVDCIFYGAGFIMNFIFGIIHCKKNIKFVLTFQKVHELLNCEKTSRRFIIWNWIIVIVFQFGFMFLYTYFFISLPLYLMYCLYLLAFVNSNVIYATRVIMLLENKVALWIIQALNSQNIEENYKQSYCKSMFQAYVNILECYDIWKDCFQELILYHIIAAFAHSLVYIHVVIETMKNAQLIDILMDDATITSFTLVIWVIKDLTWQTILSKQCEKFYLTIQSVQDSCALILKTNNSSDAERKLCKNVLRLHRASFSKIRVCGLFYLDAALQLSLMSLLTNNTILLLQFAFL